MPAQFCVFTLNSPNSQHPLNVILLNTWSLMQTVCVLCLWDRFSTYVLAILPLCCRHNQPGYRPSAGNCIPGKGWSQPHQWNCFHHHGNALVHPAAQHSGWCPLVKWRSYFSINVRSFSWFKSKSLRIRNSALLLKDRKGDSSWDTRTHTIRPGGCLP